MRQIGPITLALETFRRARRGYVWIVAGGARPLRIVEAVSSGKE